jgi:hypothetical protein
MGGRGSGRWYRWGVRDTVGGSRHIDVRQMHKEGCLSPGLRLSWAWWDRETGKRTAYIDVWTREGMVVLSYRVRRPGEEWKSVEEPVRLVWTPCYYGGQRPWFVCPGVVNGVPCQRRVAILYGTGTYFLCRHCYDLVYASQREGRDYRLMEKARRIRMRLGGSASFSDMFPPKPKWMRWKTYSRLEWEYELADRMSWVEAANRLGVIGKRGRGRKA